LTAVVCLKAALATAGRHVVGRTAADAWRSAATAGHSSSRADEPAGTAVIAVSLEIDRCSGADSAGADVVAGRRVAIVAGRAALLSRIRTLSSLRIAGPCNMTLIEGGANLRRPLAASISLANVACRAFLAVVAAGSDIDREAADAGGA